MTSPWLLVTMVVACSIAQLRLGIPGLGSSWLIINLWSNLFVLVVLGLLWGCSVLPLTIGDAGNRSRLCFQVALLSVLIAVQHACELFANDLVSHAAQAVSAIAVLIPTVAFERILAHTRCSDWFAPRIVQIVSFAGFAGLLGSQAWVTNEGVLWCFANTLLSSMRYIWLWSLSTPNCLWRSPQDFLLCLSIAGLWTSSVLILGLGIVRSPGELFRLVTTSAWTPSMPQLHAALMGLTLVVNSKATQDFGPSAMAILVAGSVTPSLFLDDLSRDWYGDAVLRIAAVSIAAATGYQIWLIAERDLHVKRDDLAEPDDDFSPECPVRSVRHRRKTNSDDPDRAVRITNKNGTCVSPVGRVVGVTAFCGVLLVLSLHYFADRRETAQVCENVMKSNRPRHPEAFSAHPLHPRGLAVDLPIGKPPDSSSEKDNALPIAAEQQVTTDQQLANGDVVSDLLKAPPPSSPPVSEFIPTASVPVNGVIVFLVDKSAVTARSLRVSYALLHANFLVCRPYPVHIFHDPLGMAQAERDVLAGIGKSVLTFEPVDFQTLPYGLTDEQVTAWNRWGKGYRMMCRFFAGIMFQLESMKRYDWFWRLDTDSFYPKPLTFDPFVYMVNNNLLYGYIWKRADDVEVTKELWTTVGRFLSTVTLPLRNVSRLNSLLTDGTGQYVRCMICCFSNPYHRYNRLMFENNFEIANLGLFRQQVHQDLFTHLDSQHPMGFFRYRWGDAPVRAIAVHLMVDDSQIHDFFRDIPYRHGKRVIFSSYPARPRTDCFVDPPSSLNVPQTRQLLSAGGTTNGLTTHIRQQQPQPAVTELFPLDCTSHTLLIISLFLAVIIWPVAPHLLGIRSLGCTDTPPRCRTYSQEDPDVL